MSNTVSYDVRSQGSAPINKRTSGNGLMSLVEMGVEAHASLDRIQDTLRNVHARLYMPVPTPSVDPLSKEASDTIEGTLRHLLSRLVEIERLAMSIRDGN